MNTHKLQSLMYGGVCALTVLLVATGIAQAQGSGMFPGKHAPDYKVTLLPSLGGASRGSAINPWGLVAGFSDVEGTGTRHATLWVGGTIIDLGTLGDPETTSSSVPWPGLNNRGTISGISQINELDPLGQEWSCARGGFLPDTGQICLGFAHMNGEMKPMPTLGGHNSFAAGINNRNQVVGWAETDFEDPTCEPPQVLGFLGLVWDAGTDEVRELPPVPGDSASAAVGINDRGQVVGISGECDQAVGRLSAKHAVLWEKDGTIRDLGNLGGNAWHTPVDINQRGDVVGFSNLAQGTDFSAHGFLWTKRKGMEDLGTLPGDLFSQANSINEWRQIVGGSFDPIEGRWRAVLWHNGTTTNLNDLIDSDIEHHLYFARDIDNLGRITGEAIDANTGQFRGFVATPNYWK